MGFYIQSLHNKLYMQINGSEEGAGSSVIVDNFHGKKNQQWKYVNGKIVSKVSGFVLDLEDDDKVILAELKGDASQNWVFDDDLTVANNIGVVLDVRGGSKTPGAEIIAFKKHGGLNQQFRVVPVNKTN
ncbi:hypothetical protein L9F63_008883 [Diploptera punctata]|uniref:Ricin B lectin domain-containing protein n=1 Tax=Diploptera punctata TaxID=6984 RepID=A0AAD7Z4U5_DIPPU|nr:hypothetical protein L9F63_008883 [Diploptera punctata]